MQSGAQPVGAPQPAGARTAGVNAVRAARPLPAGVYEMQSARMVDNNGFERPLVAATILIPAGWTLKGGVQWGAFGLCGPDYASNVDIASPDGASHLRVFPAANWSATQSNMPIGPQQPPQGGCESAAYRGVHDYLQATAARLFPGARVLDYRDLPDEARAMRDMLAQNPPMASPTMRTQINYEAGEILIAYQEGGRDMRAAISAGTLVMQVALMSMMTPGQVDYSYVSGWPGEITVASAPAGALDLGLRHRIARSARFQPEWIARLRQYQERKAQQAMKSSADRHKINMDAIKKQGEIQSGIYSARDLSSDRSQREYIESVRGVETYDDPVTGDPVELDYTYNYAYRVDGRDAYILTNDANFNPGDFGVTAQIMTPTP
ncbi:MAG: hypothetical protein R3C51_01105 [Parvularculaceae bacterium]